MMGYTRWQEAQLRHVSLERKSPWHAGQASRLTIEASNAGGAAGLAGMSLEVSGVLRFPISTFQLPCSIGPCRAHWIVAPVLSS